MLICVSILGWKSDIQKSNVYIQKPYVYRRKTSQQIASSKLPKYLLLDIFISSTRIDIFISSTRIDIFVSSTRMFLLAAYVNVRKIDDLHKN